MRNALDFRVMWDGIMSWYLGLLGKLRGKLDVLLRKMVRFVYGWGPRTHVGTGTLREFGTLPLSMHLESGKA